MGKKKLAIGTSLNFESAESRLQVLKILGESVQEGTPSFNNPSPITNITQIDLIVTSDDGKVINNNIALSESLCGLPNGIKDEKLYNSTRKIIDVIEFNGTEQWEYEEEFNRYKLTLSNQVKASNINFTNSMCTHFVGGNTESISESYNIDENGYIFFKTSNVSSLDEWKNWLSTQNSNNVPLTVYCELYSPIITKTSEIIINAFVGRNNIECSAYSYIMYPELEEPIDFLKITNKGILEPLGLVIDYNKTNLPLMAEAMETSQSIAGTDGDIVFNTTYGARLFEITALTEDFLEPTEKEQQREKVRQMLNKIKNKTTKLIIEPLNRTFMVKYNGLAEDNNLPKCVEFIIPLKSSNAYAISNEEYVSRGEEYFSSNTVAPTGFVMEIEGPVNFPSWIFNGVEMRYDNLLVEGTKLVIDTKKCTVTHVSKLGDKTNFMPYYNHIFPKIENGVNSLFVNSGVDINQIKISWYDLLL